MDHVPKSVIVILKVVISVLGQTVRETTLTGSLEMEKHLVSSRDQQLITPLELLMVSIVLLTANITTVCGLMHNCVRLAVGLHVAPSVSIRTHKRVFAIAAKSLLQERN